MDMNIYNKRETKREEERERARKRESLQWGVKESAWERIFTACDVLRNESEKMQKEEEKEMKCYIEKEVSFFFS
jgi:hypothetical protein